MLWNDSLMIFFILFLCFTIFYLLLNKKISSTQFVFLAIAILLIDIGRVDKRIINPPNDIANTVLKNKKYLNAQFNEDEIIKFLKEDKTKFRVLPLGSFADNRLVAFNIETVTGYHPAKLALYEKLMSEVGMNENILKLLNVKYLLSPQELSDEQESNLSLVRVKSGKYYNNFEYKDAYVYEYMHSEPRIQFVHNLSFINSDIEGYNLLLNQDFSISNDSFLSKNDMDKINLEDISYNTNSSLEIIEWTPNKIIIASNVAGDKNHFAVLSESYFPYGWEVEGALGSHIFKVDNFIRGFMVSPGKSQITLSFKPKDISYGSLLTYFFLILILILIFSAKIRPLNERI